MCFAAFALSLLALSGAPAAGRVNAAEVNIHVSPSGSSPIIGFSHRGSELQIKGCVPSCEPGEARWYRLSPRGAVRASLLSVDGEDLAPEPDDYVYTVVLGPVEIREAPSPDAKVVGELGPHRSVAFLDEPDAPEGWLRYRLGGWVPTSAVKVDRPSTFGGELDPVLPVAFLPDTVRLGTRQDRIVIARQARFGAAEVGARQVVAGGFTLPREQVRIAWGRARPRDVKKDARWIHIDLEEQVLTAYEGDRPVLATLISSGKKGHETVPGRWAVWMKSRHDRMHGRDYDLEEVPWSMYFHDDQALHGAFWHDRFGHRLTHGCVNLAVADAAWLFEWTSPDVPAGWHSATWTAGLQVTPVLVEKRIAPEDRLRPIRAPELHAVGAGDLGDLLGGLAHQPGGLLGGGQPLQ